MDVESLKGTFDRLLGKLERQKRQADAVDSWLRPDLTTGFTLPRKASWEHRALAELSRTPWLKLVVDNVVQAMYVDQIFAGNGPSSELWDWWQSQGMHGKQVSNHRAMVAYGQSFAVLGLQAGAPVVRFYSPRLVAVEFEELGVDEFPVAALQQVKCGEQPEYVLHFEGVQYRVRKSAVATEGVLWSGWELGEPELTGLPIVPIVRFWNQLDLDGRVLGEVEPFIPAAQRINKTAYDRLLSQHFNSWKVKTATGIDLPTQSGQDEWGNPVDVVDVMAAERLKVKLAQDDILIGESPDTRFGTLDATSLDPFVNSWRADIEALAAASQTPAHALTGQMVNLSAEALAAARAPLTQKVYERQMNAGVAYARMLRIAAAMMGLGDLGKDSSVRVTWQDMEIRSMAQAVDALGKASQMLRVPARALWGMIPGVERSDVEEWERLAEEDAEADPLNAVFRRQGESTVEAVSGGSDV